MARTLAIGDIHGCLTALDTLLGVVKPTTEDRLIFLGDYIDRGPDSKGVLDRLIELRKSRQVVCLRGNHEIMMMAAECGASDFKFWLTFGGIEALESYGEGSSLGSIPYYHWQFVKQTCVDWHETDTHIFVHASLHPDLPLNAQPTDWLHWQALNEKWHRPHGCGKTMICGHTEQRSGVPLRLMGAICIDTWVYGDGWLTCLDVETGEYWQANELGMNRADQIPV
jgi:serine/threonine protein phosphatase 1